MNHIPMSYNSIGMQAEVGLPIGIWGTPLLGIFGKTLYQSKCSIMINGIVSLSRTIIGQSPPPLCWTVAGTHVQVHTTLE